MEDLRIVFRELPTVRLLKRGREFLDAGDVGNAAIVANVLEAQKKARLSIDASRPRRYSVAAERPSVEDSYISVVLNSRSDESYMSNFGVDVEGFYHIADGTKDYLPSDDYDGKMGRRKTFDAIHIVALVLMFFFSKLPQRRLAILFGIADSYVSKLLSVGKAAMALYIDAEPLGRIMWPDTSMCETYWALIRNKYRPPATWPDDWKPFAFIDGVRAKIPTPPTVAAQADAYCGYKQGHYCNNIIVAAPDGTIIQCVLNAPGCRHDVSCVSDIPHKTRTQSRGYHLVADSGFYKLDWFPSIFLVPLSRKRVATGTPEEVAAEEANSAYTVLIRQAAEWAIGSLKKSFGRPFVLGSRLPHERHRDMVTCVRLFNFRVRKCHLGQIYKVYVGWVLKRNQALTAIFNKPELTSVRRALAASGAYTAEDFAHDFDIIPTDSESEVE